MNKYIKIFIFFLISTTIFLLQKSYSYQKWLSYELIPDQFIMDERDYAFAGYTFRQTGVPTAWSMLDIYKIMEDENPPIKKSFNGLSITQNGKAPSLLNKNEFVYPATIVTTVDAGKGLETIRLVQPFFDHPIIGSLIYSLGITNQPQSFDQVKFADYRKVAIITSYITSVLLFVFTYLVYKNIFISFLAFIIYSTIPTFVISSRFALLENLLIPFYLLTISILLLYIKFKQHKYSWLILILSGVTAGLAFLVKVAGAFIIPVCLYILYKNKVSFKKYLHFLLPFSLVTLAYYSYAYYLAPDLITRLLFNQANRNFFGPLNIFYSLITIRFQNFPLDTYWFWGFISLLIISIRNYSKHYILTISFVSFLMVYLLLGGVNYPWYPLPFLPIFISAAAYETYSLLKHPSLVSLFSFFILPFSSSFYWGYMVYRQNENNISIYRLFLLLFVFLVLLTQNKIPKLRKYSFIWVLVFILVLYQINKWNLQAYQYILANWNELPVELTVN